MGLRIIQVKNNKLFGEIIKAENVRREYAKIIR